MCNDFVWISQEGLSGYCSVWHSVSQPSDTSCFLLYFRRVSFRRKKKEEASDKMDEMTKTTTATTKEEKVSCSIQRFSRHRWIHSNTLFSTSLLPNLLLRASLLLSMTSPISLIKCCTRRVKRVPPPRSAFTSFVMLATSRTEFLWSAAENTMFWHLWLSAWPRKAEMDVILLAWL